MSRARGSGRPGGRRASSAKDGRSAPRAAAVRPPRGPTATWLLAVLTGDTAALAAPAAAPVRPLGTVRFFGYVLLAAGLFAFSYWHETSSPHHPHPLAQLFGTPWARHAALLALMVAVRYAGRHALKVVMLGAFAAVWSLLSPSAALALVLFGAATWGISRLPLGLAGRLGLAAAVATAIPCGWIGLLGPEVRAFLGQPTMLERFLWAAAAGRGILYQGECLQLADRTILSHVGSITILPLAGGAWFPPIPYHMLLGRYGGADPERNLRRGLGLLAAGLCYQLLLETVLAPHVYGVLSNFAVTLGGAAASGRAAPSTGQVVFAVLFYLPTNYVHVAGLVFEVVGVLRLLGFDLPAGFNLPFWSFNFLERWRRWNTFYYEAMRVFYFPAVGWLRKLMRPTAALVGAFGVVFLGEIVVRDVIGMLATARGTLRPMIVSESVVRLTGTLITIGTVYWLMRPGRANRQPALAGRLFGSLLTHAVAGAIMTSGKVLFYYLGSRY